MVRLACIMMAAVCSCCRTFAAAPQTGKIKGTTGGNERGAIAWTADGRLAGWTVTGPSGRYEFGDLDPGAYLMLLDGKIVPFVRVLAGQATVVDQANQPKLSFEKEVWGPARLRFAQSFVARGTAVTGFSLWRPSGSGPLAISLYADSPAGERIAGPHTTGEMSWICWAELPAEEFRTVPGKRYALELSAADGKTWTIGMPRAGDVYPYGVAFFDGAPHAESDLGLDINEQQPGLVQVARAREDLHFIKEGPGSGNCRIAGQTFIASTPTILGAYANCGFPDGIKDFVFSIHEGGPGGRQIGPACTTRMVSNWGSDVLWFPGAVEVTPGQRYYLQYHRADGEAFFSYLSADVYASGRAFRDGRELPEQFDQLFSITGEQAPGSVTYPYNVRVVDVTDSSAKIQWQTGTPADEIVHFGTTAHLTERAGSESPRQIDHRIMLTGLRPGTAYLYRVSSHTHRQSAQRTWSRVYSFLTLPRGEDRPRWDRPIESAETPACPDCFPIVNPGFEDGLAGWTVRSRRGRASSPETYRAEAPPLGTSTGGVDGYQPHSGRQLYGWSYFGSEDPTWTEAREDWNQELLTQRVTVEPGHDYVLTAWLLTGDRGSGWGRDSRIRLAVDEENNGLLDAFETVEKGNATQWFATRHQWLPVSLRFRARRDHVTIGVQFLQWWALQANHLYVDELMIRPAGPSPGADDEGAKHWPI